MNSPLAVVRRVPRRTWIRYRFVFLVLAPVMALLTYLRIVPTLAPTVGSPSTGWHLDGDLASLDSVEYGALLVWLSPHPAADPPNRLVSRVVNVLGDAASVHENEPPAPTEELDGPMQAGLDLV